MIDLHLYLFTVASPHSSGSSSFTAVPPGPRTEPGTVWLINEYLLNEYTHEFHFHILSVYYSLGPVCLFFYAGMCKGSFDSNFPEAVAESICFDSGSAQGHTQCMLSMCTRAHNGFQNVTHEQYK